MQLLTKKEVANRCKMPVKWVEKAASSGKIPSPVYLDGNKRWREKDIDKWIDNGCPLTKHQDNPAPGEELLTKSITLKEIEKYAYIGALKQANGNREKAARLLGVGERTVYRKIKEYGLDY